MSFVRKLALCFGLGVLAALTSCGGGQPREVFPTEIGFPSSMASLADPNVVAITVKAGPGNNVNIPYVTVTVCVPESKPDNCKTIDHVLLDTGSVGLRLFASVLNASEPLALPAHRIGNSSTITECAQFLDALAWGSVQVADVVIGKERAANVPIQVLQSDLPAPLIEQCGDNPVLAQDVASASNLKKLGANGILGVGIYVHDGQNYFNCTTSSACLIAPTASEQVQNPAALFPVNNNGVVVQMPHIGDKGATTVNGFLVFGISTQPNNQLDTATVVALNRSGGFTSTYKGKSYPHSFIDSGSNGLFFPDDSLSANCAVAKDFYCPAGTQALTASIHLGGKNSQEVKFSIANADDLVAASHYAFNNLGGPVVTSGFDWGLPFFYGRSVYTAIEDRTVESSKGPFYAFTVSE